jgi:hypothetical protein
VFGEGGTELLRVVVGPRLIPLKVLMIVIHIHLFTIIIATILEGVDALTGSVIDKEHQHVDGAAEGRINLYKH